MIIKDQSEVIHSFRIYPIQRLHLGLVVTFLFLPLALHSIYKLFISIVVFSKIISSIQIAA